VKIADFGVCKIVREGIAATMGLRVGTELYMAPEVHSQGVATFKSDIWSFGMVLVQLLTLQPPYSTLNLPLDTVMQMVKQGVSPPLPEAMCPQLQRIMQLIVSCLQQAPDHRPSIEQLVMAFFRL